MNFLPKKERKALAKKLGLVKKKESFKEMCERLGRAQEFGKMLHMQHLQNVENKLKKNQEQEPIDQKDQEELKSIISGENPEE